MWISECSGNIAPMSVALHAMQVGHHAHSVSFVTYPIVTLLHLKSITQKGGTFLASPTGCGVRKRDFVCLRINFKQITNFACLDLQLCSHQLIHVISCSCFIYRGSQNGVSQSPKCWIVRPLKIINQQSHARLLVSTTIQVAPLWMIFNVNP